MWLLSLSPQSSLADGVGGVLLTPDSTLMETEQHPQGYRDIKWKIFSPGSLDSREVLLPAGKICATCCYN